jgi:hypothetical protein
MSTTRSGSGTETYSTRGEHLLARVKELIREGNVRRIIIKNDDGRTLLELPLSVGVVGAALAPALAAIGAVAALVADCTIEVQRVEKHTATEDLDASPDDQVPDTEC